MRYLFLMLAVSCAAQQIDWVNQVKRKPALDVREYQFTRTNGAGASGDLSASGAGKTITLTPCPKGVNGADANHYYYISGGTGTAEAVLGTGGTCTSGAASGTIIVTTANTHTGAWTVTSATTGNQEATNVAAASGGGEIYLSSGTIRARTTVPSNIPIAYRGGGVYVSNLTVGAGYNGDVFYAEQAVGQSVLASWEDFSIGGNLTATSGYGIHIKSNTAGNPYIRRVTINNTFGGVWVDDSDYVTIDALHYWQTASTVTAEAGIKFTGTPSDCRVQNSMLQGQDNTTAGILPYGIRVEGADGILVVNTFIRANDGVSFSAANGTQVASFFFDNGIIDTVRRYAIYAEGAATPVVFGNIRFSDSHIIGNVLNNPGIVLIGAQMTDSFQLADNVIANFRTHCIDASDTKGLQLLGNLIKNCNKAAGGGATGNGVNITNATRLTIIGNEIGDSGGTPLQRYGIAIGGTPMSGVISLNTIFGNVASAMLSNTFTVSGPLRIEGNVGVDDVIPTVASAATVALPPFNPDFLLSGTTGVTAFSGLWAGRSGTFITPDGAVTFTAGATIGNTLTTTQNKAHGYWTDGTKVYLY